MLESTVSDQTPDGMFENGLEVLCLHIDADIALSWASGKKRCTPPTLVFWSTKSGAVGVKVFITALVNFSLCTVSKDCL
jgi:hypothetical protein